MFKKFIAWFNPTKEEMHTDEAKRLLHTITSRFSIEEQDDIVYKLKAELVAHRSQEIIDTEKHLLRLQFSLGTMQLVPSE